MKIRRKLKSRSGFSLAETLVATIILLLVSAIVAEGIPVAKNAYEKVVYAANAKVMLSTAITALRNEFSTAQRIKADGTSITYYSADRGADSKIYLNSGGKDDSDSSGEDADSDSSGEDADSQYIEGTIMLQEYMDYGGTTDASFFKILNPGWTESVSADVRELIASLEATRGRKDKLYVCCSRFDYSSDDRLVTVKGLEVRLSSDNRILAQIGDGTSGGDLIIRVIPNDATFAGA